jgi:hypothetical protein
LLSLLLLLLLLASTVATIPAAAFSDLREEWLFSDPIRRVRSTAASAFTRTSLAVSVDTSTSPKTIFRGS